MPEEQKNQIERREAGGGIARRSDLARRGMRAFDYVSGLSLRQEAGLQPISPTADVSLEGAATHQAEVHQEKSQMGQGIVRSLVYSRVSIDSQERDGTSLDTQERAGVEYAEPQSWHVVECIRDTATGASLDRPGIERVRQMLRQGAADVAVSWQSEPSSSISPPEEVLVQF